MQVQYLGQEDPQENLLAVGVFGLCTALVQVGGAPPQP